MKFSLHKLGWTMAVMALFDLSTSSRSTAAASDVECNQEIATYYSTNDVAQVLSQIVAVIPELAAFTQGNILPALQNGIQVRKVCGSCADYPNEALCPSHVNGFDVPHSGLLISPIRNKENDHETIDDDLEVLQDGTKLLNLHFHGVIRHAQAAPSSAAFPPNILVGAGFDVFLGMVFSATTGTYTLLPDYQGFGASAPALLPATIVQQGYVTATWPVVQAAKTWVAQASDCWSAIGNQVLMTGYSEGGYAAVAVMDALESAFDNDATDLQVVQSVVGAGAFRPGLQLVESFRSFTTPGVLDPSLRFITALTAIPFSSTTTDVANFEQGQDLIDPDQQGLILEGFRNADDDNDVNNLISAQDPFGFWNPTYLDLLEQALANDIADPCQSDLVVKGETDLLCQAILDQDLVAALENTRIPVTLFHSPQDDLISIVNLPDIAANPEYLTFFPLQGSHQEAGFAFGLGLLQQLFLNPTTRPANLVTVEDLTLESGCPIEEAAKFKATVICSGGLIMSESSDEPISACHVGNCGLGRPLFTSPGRDIGEDFKRAVLLPFWCDLDSMGGLCQTNAQGKLVFTDMCPPGEEAVVTITKAVSKDRNRKLRGVSSNHAIQELKEEQVEFDGKVFVVHSLI